MKTPPFLKNLERLSKAEKLTIQTNVISWPKIHASLPTNPKERHLWIKHYLLTEYKGMHRGHILRRLVGAYMIEADILRRLVGAYMIEADNVSGIVLGRAELYSQLGVE